MRHLDVRSGSYDGAGMSAGYLRRRIRCYLHVFFSDLKEVPNLPETGKAFSLIALTEGCSTAGRFIVVKLIDEFHTLALA